VDTRGAVFAGAPAIRAVHPIARKLAVAAIGKRVDRPGRARAAAL